ncbi:MAG: ABC transporter permease [Clostridiales bacterium]|nr:ABC transporter permease [Clostridiales bacterium]
MNVFSKVTLAGLKKNRTRTIVTVIGVILSAAMLMAVTSFISSFQSYLLRLTAAQDGDWHAKFADVDAAFVQEVSDNPKVERTAAVQNLGYAQPQGDMQNTNKPYIFVLGFSDAAYEMLPVRLIEGRLPLNGAEIVLPAHLAATGMDCAIGDLITLGLGVRSMEGQTLYQNSPYMGEDENFAPGADAAFTVVGICERPGFESYSAPGYTAITAADAGAGNSFDAYIRMKHLSRGIYETVPDLADSHGYSYNSEYLRFSGVSNIDSFNAVLYTLGGILIGLIVIGSVLLIYNSFSISVAERTRQFGILSSVGATKRQLRRSVLFEGACIGLIGIPLGIGAGIGGIAVTLRFVGSVFARMSSTGAPLTLVVSPAALIVAIVMGIAVILISAYIPARRAARRPAIESIRQTHDIQIKGRALRTSKLTLRLWGLPGMLARKNFKRNKKQYRSTVISLFVSIVLFVSASSFGMYLTESTEKTFDVSAYDIEICSHFMTDDELLALYGGLQSVAGVTESGYRTDGFLYRIELPRAAYSERFLKYMMVPNEYDTLDWGLHLSFIDDATYAAYLRALGLPASHAPFPAVGLVQGYDGERVVSFSMFRQAGDMTLHATLDYPAYAGEHVTEEQLTLEVTLVDRLPEDFSTRQYGGLTVFAPYSLRASMPTIPQGNGTLNLCFRSDDPATTAAEMDRFLQDAGLSDRYQLFNTAQMQQETRNILLVISVFAYGFIVLMSLITIANVFNTISTNISLRRREFAMLRSVGLGERSFRKMMVFECLFYGFKALLYGLPVSLGITWLIWQGTAKGVDMVFRLPWTALIIAVCAVFAVVFVTMLYSVRRLKGENMVEALR